MRAIVTGVCILLLGAAYLRGWMVLRSRRHGAHSSTRLVAFAAAWIVLIVALSPYADELTDRSFAAHMIQHELLMVVAAPLFVLSRAVDVSAWSMPRVVRGHMLRSVAPFVTPARALVLHGLAIWLWHSPVAFDAAEAHPTIHAAQHVSFLGTGVLFWWTALRPRQRRTRGVAILSLFLTAVHTSVLGALLAVSRTVVYHAYAAVPGALGEQQIAGLVMWIPANVVYLIAALFVARKWIEETGPIGEAAFTTH